MSTDTAARPCQWVRDPEQVEYHTDCGTVFAFLAGGNPSAGGFKYCPFCSKTIEFDEPALCMECGYERDSDSRCRICNPGPLLRQEPW